MDHAIKQEGLSLVIKDGKVGYMENNGKMLLAFQWENGNAFSHCFAFVENNGAYAVINNKGEYITDFIWATPSYFEKYDKILLAKVSMQTDAGLLEGYINHDGLPICGIKLPS